MAHLPLGLHLQVTGLGFVSCAHLGQGFTFQWKSRLCLRAHRPSWSIDAGRGLPTGLFRCLFSKNSLAPLLSQALGWYCGLGDDQQRPSPCPHSFFDIQGDTKPRDQDTQAHVHANIDTTVPVSSWSSDWQQFVYPYLYQCHSVLIIIPS